MILHSVKNFLLVTSVTLTFSQSLHVVASDSGVLTSSNSSSSKQIENYQQFVSDYSSFLNSYLSDAGGSFLKIGKSNASSIVVDDGRLTLSESDSEIGLVASNTIYAGETIASWPREALVPVDIDFKKRRIFSADTNTEGDEATVAGGGGESL